MEVEGRRGAEAEPGGDADDERGGGVRAAASHAGEGPRGGGRGRPRRAGAASGWSSLSRRARRARLGPHELGGIWRRRVSAPFAALLVVSVLVLVVFTGRFLQGPDASSRFTPVHVDDSTPRTVSSTDQDLETSDSSNQEGEGVTKKLSLMNLPWRQWKSRNSLKRTLLVSIQEKEHLAELQEKDALNLTSCW
ncbi:uncharacterized protein LOC119291894 isoform X2 [Triticum dicoccoides]|uniref:uncharacterized protein n=1 Tax=Triticum aestivum TaxID=4565 RepID=UPI00188E0ECE|nr:uncharacterized protein LOC119291894 isoform X2 [Triticum dicoccoides]XP_044346685.1 uncharacterized protein LOC123068240 [Triticum aestivum]XP_044346693.1 uncharacterized protein LOC123068240 [Triticum aestivum]XP_044346702.1 uncharacterized protein LOC123068240 [Triticum aestivum]XP_044346709.1 uncharacterized protein LOC123068240 [Triticum aestivum]XP_044346718.1 uncharacterized protein LOC123068240 [Triticum aestivum]